MRGSSTPSRTYSGGSVSIAWGSSATTSPPSMIRTRSPSVTRPMTSECSPQRSKTACAWASCPRRTTTSIRSWLSESITS